VRDAEPRTGSAVADVTSIGMSAFRSRHAATSTPAQPADVGLEVGVLGTFRFRWGTEMLPPEAGGSQRLLALLALRDRVMMRSAVAGTLWPESSEDHAHSSLRSALARLSELSREAVVVTPLDLCLDEAVGVDIRESRSLAHRLLDPGAALTDADLGPGAIAALSDDLLPDWYDDWVLLEAEEWRQLRAHALEELADRLTAQRRFGLATAAALAAVRIEPLRESARATVIRVHRAEGNPSEALREFGRYAALLNDELGLEPTPRLRDLVADL
jgi:SARP family transcriptional regulator, regulator of embCAB operon